MRAGRPSRTAALVALGRALADAGVTEVPGFREPTARIFLGDRGRAALERTAKAARAGRNGIEIRFARMLANMMALRTLAIDAAVRDAIGRGATQLVVLGAGFDGRAWRLSELAGRRVFEVDHPATQGIKRAHVAGLPPAIGAVTFVPIDFERSSPETVLREAGHDPSAATCWVWEGVTMYLPHDVVGSTLASIAGRSAPGSTAIVNYHADRRSALTRLIFRLIGEPMISAWSPAEMAADLRSAGLEVREDSGMADWNARFAGGQANADRGWYVRIAVAQPSESLK